ncbi:bacteriocin immunity protein [Enterococcus sp. AZ163]|uniref:bacteriocin immunity protein n=1 Tax=Enterococcus sp. AZ163 TaxID=2774638 RepID=UPI003D2D93DF
MSKLKWFSGGKDRGEQALAIITDLLNELANNSFNKSLQQVLGTYKEELTKKESSVPFILSRMNLDISNALKEDGVALSASQSSKLKKLSSLSNIRYGY